MLDDLSAHLLDISQNGVSAGATRMDVVVRENSFYEIEVTDNGKGMDAERAAAVIDPFVTSRTTRRVGMGLPFLKQAAELCEGEFSLVSELGKGTTVKASFSKASIDTPPLGDIPASIMTLLLDAPKVHWVFRYEKNGNAFELDSADLAEAIDGLESLSSPDVAIGLVDFVKNGIEEL